MADAPRLELRDQAGNVMRLDERYVRLRGLPTRWATEFKKRAFSDGAVQTGDGTMESRDISLEGWIVGDDVQDNLSQLGQMIQMLRRPDVDLIIGGSARVRLEALDRVDPSFLQGTRMRASKLSFDVGAGDPGIYSHEDRLVWRWQQSELWSEGRANIYAGAGYSVTAVGSGAVTVPIGGALSYSLSSLAEPSGTDVILFLRVTPLVAWDSAASNGTAEPLKEYWCTWQGLTLLVDRELQQIRLELTEEGLWGDFSWGDGTAYGEGTRVLSWSYTGVLAGTTQVSVAASIVGGSATLYVDGVARQVLTGALARPPLSSPLRFGKGAGQGPACTFGEVVLSFDGEDAALIGGLHAQDYLPGGGLVHVYDAVDAYTTPVTFVLNLPLYATTWPVLRVTNASTTNLDMAIANLSDGARQWVYRDTGFVANLTLEADSRLGTAERDGVDTIRFALGDWLLLQPGDNTLRYQGRDARLEVFYTPRWQ